MTPLERGMLSFQFALSSNLTLSSYPCCVDLRALKLPSDIEMDAKAYIPEFSLAQVFDFGVIDWSRAEEVVRVRPRYLSLSCLKTLLILLCFSLVVLAKSK